MNSSRSPAAEERRADQLRLLLESFAEAAIRGEVDHGDASRKTGLPERTRGAPREVISGDIADAGDFSVARRVFGKSRPWRARACRSPETNR